jgi:hypothetical protein
MVSPSNCAIVGGMTTYRVVHTAAIQGRHGTLGRSWVIVFDEPVVEPLGLHLDMLASSLALKQTYSSKCMRDCGQIGVVRTS